MYKYYFIGILILIMSCRATYDKEVLINNNLQSFRLDSLKKVEERNNYIDSIFNYVSSKNNIKLYSHFINSFPNSNKINIAKKSRKKLFFDKEKVLESNLNIDSLLEINACYAPLYKKIDYVKKRSFSLEEIINSDLDSLNPYRNRFIVADLNNKNLKGKSRGIKEVHFNEKNSWEFKNINEFILNNKINTDSIIYMDLNKLIVSDNYNEEKIRHEFKLLKNYYEKVKKYKEPEVEKIYSIFKGRKYNVGQNLCFCEIKNDTIILEAKHVTSSQGQTRRFERDSITNELILNERGKRISIYSKRFPLKQHRGYYAPVNKLSSRNWDRERNYDEDDQYRDSILGGGKSTVALFDSVVPLPNFITLFPDKKKYKKAVQKNGIHEGSLNLMSRCMLGTPQSLGCFRMNDYGSKFARWWIPNHTNFFVYFDENRYSGEQIDSTQALVPFWSPKEGDVFRAWIHKNYPDYAKEIDLDISGSCNNCYVYLAWQRHGKEFIESKEGKKFKNRKMELSKEKEKEKEKENSNEIIKQKNNYEKFFKEKDSFKIKKKYEIVINCLENEKITERYIKKLKKKNYKPTFTIDNKSNCYLIKLGLFTNEKEANTYLNKIKSEITNDAWIYISMQ
tara:strand:- start:3276 stop:5138 length:1863 start_codon:yes stop_codon:yes gene_type:complete